MTLLNEIFEQPSVISNLINSQRESIDLVAKKLQEMDIRYIYLVARGTSDNAGKYAQYLFGAENKLPTALGTPSLFSIYHQPPNLKSSLVIGISQSGKSPDIISVIKEANRQKCPTLVITNTPQSPLAEIADFVVDIQTGEEKAVAATKTYTATLTAIAMLSASLSHNESMRNDLLFVPDWISKILSNKNEINQIAEKYFSMEKCVVLGRGYNYSTAYEWSLKLTELSKVLTEPYSSADFLHGPIAMLNGLLPVFSVAPKGKGCKPLLDLLRNLKTHYKAEIFSISNQDEVLSISKEKIRIPSNIPEWLSPIICIIPAQIFSYQITQLKGLDPDKPIGLHKITKTN